MGPVAIGHVGKGGLAGVGCHRAARYCGGEQGRAGENGCEVLHEMSPLGSAGKEKVSPDRDTKKATRPARDRTRWLMDSLRPVPGVLHSSPLCSDRRGVVLRSRQVH